MPNLSGLRKFVAPEIIFGAGARKLAGRYAKQFLASKVLIVTDPGVIKAGWLADVVLSLEKVSIPYHVYSNVTSNPRDIEVMEGADVYRTTGCDVIIAIGGGSSMDCAKGIGMVSSNNLNILEFEGIDKILLPPPPQILIPTTAGTSSDVSQFCIITNLDELVKFTIVSKAIVSDVSLIDYETTTTMDSYLTACTGLDALVHAVEAFISIGNGQMTDSNALEAISLVYNNLPKLLNDEMNMDLREKVMHGSMKAGLAFSNASLGAVHAMAHSVGGFLDTPHGESISMILEHVINFNYNKVPERFKVISEKMGIDVRGLNSKEIKNRLLSTVVSFKNDIGIKTQLGDKGVKSADIPGLSKKAMNDVCMLTNPRPANKRDLEVIFEESM